MHTKHTEYVKFSAITPSEFLPILNNNRTREHLIEHDWFDIETTKAWMESKIQIDRIPGCKVRAIVVDKQLAGWCGIQLENEQYELAVVISDEHWGLGRTIFQDMMIWAKDLGHQTVFIHLLHTRPEYKFLRKIAANVYKSEFLGNKFISYELNVQGKHFQQPPQP